MRLHRIKLAHFKGISAREVTFPDSGVVIISGANEVGKTSLVEALDMVLNDKHTSLRRHIRQAQPVGSDESPCIEVELTMAQHRVVLSKTWLKGAKVTLRFVDGPRRGEQLSGDSANDAFERLWTGRDDVLWQALRLLQATGLDQQHLGDSRTLTAVLDRGAAPGPGTDTTDTVLSRAQNEFAVYFTQTGRPTKALEQVREAVGVARRQYEAARAQVESLDDARSELAAAISECEELTDRIAGAEAEVSQWEVKEAELAEVRARHQRASDQVRAARLAQEVAEVARRSRAELTERVAEEVRRVGEARAEVDEVTQRESARADHRAGVDERVGAATQQVATLTAAIRQLERRREHLQDLATLDQLRRLRAEIDARRQELAALRAQDRPECDDDYFARLDAAHARANEARWRLESSSARLHLEVLGDQPVLVDGEPVTGATDLTVTRTTLLAVPEVLQLRIDAAPEAELRTAADKAHAEWQRILAVARVSDMAEATALRAGLDRLRADARVAQSRLDHVLDGHDEALLREQIDQLEVRAGSFDGPREPVDATDCDQSLAELAATLVGAERELLEASTLRDADAQAADQLRVELTRSRTRLDTACQVAERVQAQLDQQRQTKSDEDIVRDLERATREVELALLEDRQVTRELEALGADTIAADAQLARNYLAGLQNSLDRAERRRIEARAALAAMQPDLLQERFDQAATQLAAAESTAEAWELRARRAKLLLDTLITHRQAIQARYVEPFRQEVAALGRTLHADADFDVRITEDLVIDARYLQGRWLSFGALSTGAREQLVILVRIAAARLVHSGDKVPVILDDALGYSDQTRRRRMWTALDRAGEDCQVFILTANPERYAGLLSATHIQLTSTR